MSMESAHTPLSVLLRVLRSLHWEFPPVCLHILKTPSSVVFRSSGGKKRKVCLAALSRKNRNVLAGDQAACWGLGKLGRGGGTKPGKGLRRKGLDPSGKSKLSLALSPLLHSVQFPCPQREGSIGQPQAVPSQGASEKGGVEDSACCQGQAGVPLNREGLEAGQPCYHNFPVSSLKVHF